MVSELFTEEMTAEEYTHLYGALAVLAKLGIIDYEMFGKSTWDANGSPLTLNMLKDAFDNIKNSESTNDVIMSASVYAAMKKFLS